MTNTTASPMLPIIADWIATYGDDALDLLTSILEDAMTAEREDAEKWDPYRPGRVEYDLKCAAAAQALRDALFPLIPQPTEEEKQAAVNEMMSFIQERIDAQRKANDDGRE